MTTNPNHGPRDCGHPGCARHFCRFANTEPAEIFLHGALDALQARQVAQEVGGTVQITASTNFRIQQGEKT